MSGEGSNERNFRAMREALANEKRSAAASSARVGELEAEVQRLRDESERREIERIVKDAGLSEHVVEDLLKLEVPAAQAQDFMLKRGWVVEDVPEDAPKPQSVGGFKPFQGGSTVVDDSTARISYETFQSLMKTNRPRAEALFAANKVDGLPAVQETGREGEYGFRFDQPKITNEQLKQAQR